MNRRACIFTLKYNMGIRGVVCTGSTEGRGGASCSAFDYTFGYIKALIAVIDAEA